MGVERVIVVDKSDRPIGTKPRPNITHDDIYRVASLWVTNPRGKILLAQRSFNKPNYAGLWGSAVAGTVAEGETYDSNIYKEAEEEIGLTDQKFTSGPKFYFDSGKRRSFIKWYLVEFDRPADSFTKQADEVAELRWLNPTELRADLSAHPERYLPSAVRWLELFLK